jgi:sulfite exporter TauE/SafE
MPEADNAEPPNLFHSHVHSHGDYIHSHSHGHQPEHHPHWITHTPVSLLDQVLGKLRLYQNIRPLVIGIVHGLAGSAAVALLVLATIRDPYWAVAYLLIFGIGTIAGMVLITMSIASTVHIFRKSKLFFRRLALASGVLSLCFGLVVAYQIGIAGGLLTHAPRWVPR